MFTGSFLGDMAAAATIIAVLLTPLLFIIKQRQAKSAAATAQVRAELVQNNRRLRITNHGPAVAHRVHVLIDGAEPRVYRDFRKGSPAPAEISSLEVGSHHDYLLDRSMSSPLTVAVKLTWRDGTRRKHVWQQTLSF